MSHDIIVFLCHYQECHWQLIIFYNRLKQIETIDPLGWSGMRNAKLLFWWLYDNTYLFHTYDEFQEFFQPDKLDYGWSFYQTHPALSNQLNGYDCGVFCLLYLQCMLFQLDLIRIQRKDCANFCKLWIGFFTHLDIVNGKKTFKEFGKAAYFMQSLPKKLPSMTKKLPNNEETQMEHQLFDKWIVPILPVKLKVKISTKTNTIGKAPRSQQQLEAAKKDDKPTPMEIQQEKY